MPTRNLESGAFAGEELRNLVTVAPPCITILLPLPTPLEIHTRLKNAIRRAEQALKERDVEREKIEELMRPLQALAQTIETDGVWGEGLVALRSPAVFRHFW